MKPLRMIDTFSGIGGFSLAARWLGGIETVQFVEREPFCQRILAKHWPTVPIHDDICTFNPEPHSADIVCGGFPCQDISQAGKGAGLAGSRSGLFYELLRVVRLVGPRYIVLENVAAITYRGMDDVLGALAEAGYDAEWACIPAAAVGACHQRNRWWCVAYASGSGSSGRIPTGITTVGEKGGGRMEPEPQRHCAEPAADSIGLRSQRRGAARDLAGQAGAGEVDRQERQRDGDAADDCGAVALHTDGQRQPQQHTPALAARAGQPAWPPAPRRLNSDWRSYLSQPVLRRGDDGLSGRVDRLKALGNAVVPQVAMIPLARVLELERARSAEPASF
jgi:DNA (cytosine-5)-methyltransferase 1